MKTNKPPKHKPDPLLKKSHAHPDKTKYNRKRNADDGTWQKEIDANCPHLNIQDLTDKSGSIE